MDIALQNKVAVVTGGARGLGRAICLTLAAEGARVAVNHRRHSGSEAAARAAALEQLLSELRTSADRAAAVAADVTREEEVVAMFDRAEAELGPVDVLVNNAGTWPTAFVHDMTLAEWQQTIDINLTAAFLCSREAVRRWLAAGRKGRIVNIVSQASFAGATTGHAHYAAAKAGLLNFTISLAREMARHGIHVNAVAPGMTDTDMTREAMEQAGPSYLARIPLGRIAEPEEVARVVAFLASERASYVTGATWNVTGGMVMR